MTRDGAGARGRALARARRLSGAPDATRAARCASRGGPALADPRQGRRRRHRALTRPRSRAPSTSGCLEAMQNAIKHGDGASLIAIALSDDGRLRFEVADNGRGFDAASTPSGAGRAKHPRPARGRRRLPDLSIAGRQGHAGGRSRADELTPAAARSQPISRAHGRGRRCTPERHGQGRRRIGRRLALTRRERPDRGERAADRGHGRRRRPATTDRRASLHHRHPGGGALAAPSGARQDSYGEP